MYCGEWQGRFGIDPHDPIALSVMKRRAPDSNGKRGKIETPEAQLRRLDSLPVESGHP